MKREYRELVGLQVVCHNDVARYELVNYYRWKRIAQLEPIQEMHSFALERGVPIADLVKSFETAYAGAILSKWESDTVLAYAELLQFQANATPEDLDLEGPWSHKP